jgi:DNA-binding CsgD family transcriptional regulator
VSSGTHVVVDLSIEACRARDLVDYRRRALDLVARHVPFDAALFHELSPRVPLERAGIVGMDTELLERSAKHWDQNAVTLGRVRDLALERGGVATDLDAFPTGSSGRREWVERVAKPLSVSHMVIVHLVLAERIISALLLFRRSQHAFTQDEQDWLRDIVPVLTLGDAAWQGRSEQPSAGAVTRLSCDDQRLTARQRELVVRVALGQTNREIAVALSLSENTVRNLLVEVRARLGAANRAEIVRLAVLR